MCIRDRISADLFSHDDAVADNGRGVCRFNRFVQCFPTCVVVFAHFDVRAEAAGSQNDAAVRGDRRRLITLGDLNTCLLYTSIPILPTGQNFRTFADQRRAV